MRDRYVAEAKAEADAPQADETDTAAAERDEHTATGKNRYGVLIGVARFELTEWRQNANEKWMKKAMRFVRSTHRNGLRCCPLRRS